MADDSGWKVAICILIVALEGFLVERSLGLGQGRLLQEAPPLLGIRYAYVPFLQLLHQVALGSIRPAEMCFLKIMGGFACSALSFLPSPAVPQKMDEL